MNDILKRFESYLTGDFDNFAQIAAQEAAGKVPIRPRGMSAATSTAKLTVFRRFPAASSCSRRAITHRTAGQTQFRTCFSSSPTRPGASGLIPTTFPRNFPARSSPTTTPGCVLIVTSCPFRAGSPRLSQGRTGRFLRQVRQPVFARHHPHAGGVDWA